MAQIGANVLEIRFLTSFDGITGKIVSWWGQGKEEIERYIGLYPVSRLDQRCPQTVDEPLNRCLLFPDRAFLLMIYRRWEAILSTS